MSQNWFPLKLIDRRRGYQTVNLSRGGEKTIRYIHHLVLEAFVGPPPPCLIGCHNDGDRRNNRVENLRWDTYQSNSDDMLRHDTRLMGSKINAKLTEEEVLEIRRLKVEGMTFSGLAAAYGVSRQNVKAIVYRETWRHLP